MMNEREKQILKILRRNPLIQQHEIAQILDISRSRVAAHIMDLMRKGAIKGKGYILTEQDYCVALGAINMDIRGVADIRFPEPSSQPGAIQCAAGGVARNIAHNLALLGREVHLISAVGSDFYGETLLEQTRQAGVNVQSTIRLHGQSTATYLSIASPQDDTVLAINDTHILQGLTPQLLNHSRNCWPMRASCWPTVTSPRKRWSGSLPSPGMCRCLSTRFQNLKPTGSNPGCRASIP